MDNYYFGFYVTIRTAFWSRSCILLLLWIMPRHCVDALQVIGGKVTVVSGERAMLPCKLIDTTDDITQIAWQRMTKGRPQNENFLTILPKGPKYANPPDLRFLFIGSIDERNGSLQLSDVTLMDDGMYSCVITLFPSGNRDAKVPLKVLVPPVSSLELHRPILGKEEVALVTCIAAGSKPPATVRWLNLTENMREESRTIENANGTSTTVNSLMAVPSVDINHRLVQCQVTNPDLSTTETLSINVEVYFPPTDVTFYEEADGSLVCVAEANPVASFSWRRLNKPWPESAVSVQAEKLSFQTLTSDLNGFYQCVASNNYGEKAGQLYVHVSSGPCPVPWILFSLLCLLCVAAAVWYYRNRYKMQPFSMQLSCTCQAVHGYQ
ncbi:uncharacterized protein V6R79_026224 [Siganus canaliculatus]